MAARRRIMLAEFEPLIPSQAVYDTWNPADRDPALTLSGGNLTATKSTIHATQWAGVRSGIRMRAGVWYWETRLNFSGTADTLSGVTTGLNPLNVSPGVFEGLVGPDRAGNCYESGIVVANVGALASGVTIRHWLSMDEPFYRIAVGSGPFVTIRSGGPAVAKLFVIASMVRPSGSTASIVANFGSSAFQYAIPDGALPGVFSVAPPVQTTVYCSNTKFNTLAGENPASTKYLARIVADGQDVESVRDASCFVLGGQTQSGRTRIQLVNIDGRLDSWASWLWRNAVYRLYRGYEGDPRGAFTLWQKGKVETAGATQSKTRFEIVLADPLAELDRPALPESYPANQANAQAAGQPKSMVLGRPKYCEGILVSTSEVGADAFRYDFDYLGVDGFDDGFDQGDRFAGPNDPYVATTPITSANGGSFNTWIADPDGAALTMPQNWRRVTAFSATDRVQEGTTAGTLRLMSSGQVVTAIYHTLGTHSPGTRYQLQFNVTALAKAGNVIFRLDGNKPGFDEVLVPIASTGLKSVTLDCTDSNYGLQIVLGAGRTQLDATIDNFTSSSVQVIDWTRPDAKSVKLANKPAGKVTFNPVGAREPVAWIELLTFKSWTADNPDGWTVVGGPETATLRVTQVGTSARLQSDGALGKFIGIAYADPSRVLRAGKTYRVTATCSAATGMLFVMLNNGSGTTYGSVNAPGTQVYTVSPAADGAVMFRSPNGTAVDVTLASVQVDELRIAEGAPAFVRHLLVTRAGVPDADINWASVANLDSGLPNAADVIPGRVAHFVRTQDTYLRILRSFCDSFIGWCVPNRLGQLSFGSMREPSWTPVLELDKTNLVGPPSRDPDLAPGLTTTMSGARNHSPFSSDADIATSVPAALRAELMAEYIYTRAAAPELLADGLTPISQALTQALNAKPRGTLLQDPEFIQAIANRLATLWRPQRYLYRVTALLTAMDADSLEPGQTIRLTHKRYGLAGGKNLLVLGVRSRFFGRRVDLKLWG